MAGGVILVTGATGNIGWAVVETLLEAGETVRAAGRTAASPVKTFGTRVDSVALDFTDPTTWAKAFAGVDRMFLLRPPHLGNPRKQIVPALEYARTHGVHHVVFLSIQGAENNKLLPHTIIEAWLRASGITWTFVRSSYLFQNFSTTHLTDIRDRDEIPVPAGRGATAFVDAEDVGAVAAAALLNSHRYANLALTVTGDEALTFDQVAQVLTAELERPIRYTRPGVLRYLRHAHRELSMPWGMVLVSGVIYSMTRFGLTSTTTETVRQVLGRRPNRFHQFARRERDLWNPGPGLPVVPSDSH